MTADSIERGTKRDGPTDHLARPLSAQEITALVEREPWNPDAEDAKHHARRAFLAAGLGTNDNVDGIIRSNFEALAASYRRRVDALGESVRHRFLKLRDHALALERTLPSAGANFGDRDRTTIERILRRATTNPNEGERSESYLGRYGGREAINANNVREDLAALNQIMAPQGTQEHAYLTQLRGLLEGLRSSDPTNLNFYQKDRPLTGGYRAFLALAALGVAVVSLAVGAKEKRLSIKGLAAAGLLLYLIRRPGSPINFLASGRYEELTAKYGIRGPEGTALAEALMSGSGQNALATFSRAIRVQEKTPLQSFKPGEEHITPKQRLIEDLGFDAHSGPGAILAKMDPQDIQALGGMMGAAKTGQHREIVSSFVERDIHRSDIASLPVEPARMPGR